MVGAHYTAHAMPTERKWGAAEPDPDAVLMLRVKRGDRAAFAALVEKYQQPVLNFLMRSLQDEAEAEDLAQNVFVQVWKSARRYRRTARFSTWLFTIARNLCLNELRRRARHPAAPLEAAASETETPLPQRLEDRQTATPPEALLREELFQKVEAALAELPETQRAALLLCREEEFSYEDIAAILGCSLSATKSLIHRGRETLKQKLKPYLRTGEWKRPG
jgi:RNA polymerase sigma-70 factor (ECF subfamily)